MDGKVAANIRIAGKIYPTRIKVENEEIFKKAEAFIQSRMEDYYSEYPYINRDDILAILLLNMTAKLFEYQQSNDIRCSEIEQIDHKLEIYLKKQGSLDNIE